MSLKALCNRISFFHPIILLPITSKYETISQSGLVFLQIANIHHIPFTHWHPVLCSYYFLLFNPLIFKPVNYKLALAKSICQWLKNNKGVCHLPLQRLNPALLQLPTFKYRERNAGWKVRHFVLQGNCGTGLYLDIFRNWFHDPNPCISSCLEEHQVSSWWHQLLVTSRKPFVK